MLTNFLSNSYFIVMQYLVYYVLILNYKGNKSPMRKIIWHGPSLRTARNLPYHIKEDMAYQLNNIQRGLPTTQANHLEEISTNIIEVIFSQ